MYLHAEPFRDEENIKKKELYRRIVCNCIHMQGVCISENIAPLIKSVC